MVNNSVIFVAVLASAFARPADDKNEGCNTKKESFLDCFIDSGNHIFQMLSTGDKKMGLPILDPLEVHEMNVFKNGDHMHLKMMDSTHSGLGGSIIKSAQADPEHFKFKVNMSVPRYNIKGTYDMNAKLAMLPLQGKGNADVTLEELAVTWDIQGKPVDRQGKQYMEITDFKVHLVPKSMKIQLDNMFNGNKELGTSMNTFLNENWQEVMKQLRPSMEKAYSQMLKSVGSQLLERIPYKDMFPDM